MGVIPWSIFEKLNDYPGLETVDLTNNNIQGIKGKFAHEVLNVKTLILNHNQLRAYVEEDDHQTHTLTFSNFVNLESLHLTNAFAEIPDFHKHHLDIETVFLNTLLPKLTKLHMEQNEITHFNNSNIFCNLPALMDLHIADNNISKIDLNLECLDNLRFFDLRDNSIQQLPNSTLVYLDQIRLKRGNFFIDLSVSAVTVQFRFTIHVTFFLREIHSNAIATSQTS